MFEFRLDTDEWVPTPAPGDFLVGDEYGNTDFTATLQRLLAAEPSQDVLAWARWLTPR